MEKRNVKAPTSSCDSKGHVSICATIGFTEGLCMSLFSLVQGPSDGEGGWGKGLVYTACICTILI